MMYEERCCEDCEYFSPPAFFSDLYGYCERWELSANEEDEICDKFEEKY